MTTQHKASVRDILRELPVGVAIFVPYDWEGNMRAFINKVVNRNDGDKRRYEITTRWEKPVRLRVKRIV